jgi:hypothetical protein
MPSLPSAREVQAVQVLRRLLPAAAMLQHRAVYNGPLGLQARAELKQFDKAEKVGIGRKRAA